MATNITSTQLDFENIKTSLKTFLKQKSEFSDYDFEASGLNNILDVLAYNTHYNGLIANFALNESFLDTAQLRPSVISHAEMLGLDIASKTSSRVALRATITTGLVANRPTSILLPAGFTFSTTIDGNSYRFHTRQRYVGIESNGVYTFQSESGAQEITAYEGNITNKTFLVGSTTDRQVYIIPDKNIDTKTVVVNVYDSVTSESYEVYTALNNAITVDANSTYYTIRETPNGFYELNFGDGVTFGKSPAAGSKIIVNYLSTSGSVANGGSTFTANNSLTVLDKSYSLNVTTITKSLNGADLQSIDTIKQLAPVAFSTQQRLVTALDYESMIKANFTQVRDVAAWGSQDNIPVDYGKVYISLDFDDNVTQEEETFVKTTIVNTFADNLAIMSIGTKFVDPITLDFIIEANIQWDPNLTGLKTGNIENRTKNIITTYFDTTLSGFGKAFRRSALLTEIDSYDKSILGSGLNVKLQISFEPSLNLPDGYKLHFPVRLEQPSLDKYSVESNSFTYGETNTIARIRNKLNSTILQIVDANSKVIVDNLGAYFPQSGLIQLNNFVPRAIIDGSVNIKLTAIPQDQTVVKPLRNYVLNVSDTNLSVGVNIDYQNTNVVLG
tara:strand:- start:1687 stop:3528 length:1842 start_codon:yes stop_codon:yes gene_type:complete